VKSTAEATAVLGFRRLFWQAFDGFGIAYGFQFFLRGFRMVRVD
jgi:hypothetical protein